MTTDAEKLAAVRAWLKAQDDAGRTLDNGPAALAAILADAAPVTSPIPVAPPHRLLVPLYVYPAPAPLAGSWAAVAKLGVAGIAIVNPSSGDFSAADASYQRGIAQLDAAGVEWVGYVATDYGKRPLADVINDVETWPKIYKSCRGYFLDEQASSWLPIYAAIVAACRVAVPGGKVIGNPGLTGCDEHYLTIMDALVMTESANGVPALPVWAAAARDDKIALLAHGVATEAAMRSVVAQARTAGYGLIYVTDRTIGHDLWGGLPTYWAALVAAVTAP